MAKAKGAATAAQDTTNAKDNTGVPVIEQSATGVAGVPTGSPADNGNAGTDTGTSLPVAEPGAADALATAVQAPSNPSAQASAEAPPAGLRSLIEQLPEGDLKASLLAAHDAETAEAKEAAAIAVNPLAVALKAPENIASFSIEGHEYTVNEHGLIEIALEDAHRVAIALEHGFKRIGAAIKKLL